MKISRNPVLFACTLFASVLITLSACRKDAEEIVALLTESEAAEIIETAISERTGGITAPTIDMAQLLELYLENCGTPGDTTLVKSKNGGVSTFNYTWNMGWLVNCNALGVPLDANTTISGNGYYTSLHWNGNAATNGSLAFTNLNPAESNYIANGSYTLQGDITGSLRKTTPTFNCKTEITLKDLNIRKSDYMVTGGSGTAVVTGNDGKGNTQTLNGTLTFNGDGTVTVVVNGHTHSFQLQ